MDDNNTRRGANRFGFATNVHILGAVFNPNVDAGCYGFDLAEITASSYLCLSSLPLLLIFNFSFTCIIYGVYYQVGCMPSFIRRHCPVLKLIVAAFFFAHLHVTFALTLLK